MIRQRNIGKDSFVGMVMINGSHELGLDVTTTTQRAKGGAIALGDVSRVEIHELGIAADGVLFTSTSVGASIVKLGSEGFLDAGTVIYSMTGAELLTAVNTWSVKRFQAPLVVEPDYTNAGSGLVLTGFKSSTAGRMKLALQAIVAGGAVHTVQLWAMLKIFRRSAD